MASPRAARVFTCIFALYGISVASVSLGIIIDELAKLKARRAGRARFASGRICQVLILACSPHTTVLIIREEGAQTDGKCPHRRHDACSGSVALNKHLGTVNASDELCASRRPPYDAIGVFGTNLP